MSLSVFLSFSLVSQFQESSWLSIDLKVLRTNPRRTEKIAVIVVIDDFGLDKNDGCGCGEK